MFVGGGIVATDDDHVPLLLACVACRLAVLCAVFCAASSVFEDLRNNIQPTITMLMTSSTTMAIAHTGNPAFGGATFTSNRAGPVCRCRSVSDFFSASRMNDI